MKINSANLSRTARGVISVATLAAILGACAGKPQPLAHVSAALVQPNIEARAKPVLTQDRLRFKDLNANSRLDPYEDWRLSSRDRARDLVGRMTLGEKAGAMLIATNNPECDGTLGQAGRELVTGEEMSRFVLRSTATDQPTDCSVKLTGFALRGGYDQTPLQLATFTNAVQEVREASRLGIPALFKDNARNHIETNPAFGIGQGAGVFSEFPKEAGLASAALGAGAPPIADRGAPPDNLRADMGVIRRFTQVMGQEWRAIGLRGMYGYMADLGTEPRWSRFHETFSEDADLVGDIAATLVEGLQGAKGEDGLALSAATNVSMTLKHFPGGGPQQLGLDAHYTFGKYQFYSDPSGRYGFDYHLRPFERAIAAGVGSIMPYYGVPDGASHDGLVFEKVGMAFSKAIVTDLLREELGFAGSVNSDSGIIEQRGWGLEDFRTNPVTGKPYTIADRTALAIRAGTDVLSEFRDKETIVSLVESGQLNEADDVDPAVERLLIEQFALGLFEDPYVDAEAASALIGTAASREQGLDIQRRSLVLLQNSLVDGRPVLPLQAGASLYTMGFPAKELARRGYRAIDGNYDPAKGQTRPTVPEGTEFAVLNVFINNVGARDYMSADPSTGGRPIEADTQLNNPKTGQRQGSWGEQDPCTFDQGDQVPACVDDRLVFGGAFPWEAGALSFSTMQDAKSWSMYPSLADIKGVVAELGDARRVVLNIYFRQPYVLDEESGLREVGAIVANFGASEIALVDVLSGRHAPAGRLPFALPSSLGAVRSQHPDAPGYSEVAEGELFPYGFGLTYLPEDRVPTREK
jgi:beta-glucosidase